MKADLRLVLPATAAWAAAWIVIGASSAAGPAAVGLFCSCGVLAGAAWLVRARMLPAGLSAPVAGLIVCAASAALVSSAVALGAESRAPQLPTNRQLTAVVRVDSAPVLATTAGRYGAAKTQLEFRGTMTSARTSTTFWSCSSPVLVFAARTGTSQVKNGPLPEIGSTITVAGTVKANEPGDQSAFLLFSSHSPTLLAGAPWYLGWANMLRSDFSTAALSLPGDGGALLPGLSIGDVSAVSASLDTAMKTSSLSHLTAVSGANCAVIIAAVMLLGAAVGLRRGLRIAAAVSVLVGFVILVTPGPSVLRAAVMASVVIFSLAAGRPGRGMPALAVAVIALLVWDPWLAHSYGFALSVLATGGLLVLSGPLARLLTRWLPHSLAAVIAVPLAAQLACQPVLILLNPAVPLYGVAANLLAEPAAPIATVAGLVSCVLLPWASGVGLAIAHLAWVPSAWIAAVARVSSTLPGSQLPWLGGVAGLGLFAVLTLTVLAIAWWPQQRRRGLRVVAIALVLLVCGGYAGGIVGTQVGRTISLPSQWQIGACDIGQGDAVLVHSGSYHALIDVGPDPKPLTACLHLLGIDRIDLLVLTHYDLDHVGGLDAVIGHVGVALVGVPASAHDQSLLDELAAGGAEVRRAADGDHGSLGALDWRVLWPNRDSSVMQTGNDGCVTIAFDGDGIRSIFLGDLSERSQDALVATGRVRPVDVVKVAHHGSADQSERIYQSLQAKLGVISVGLGNDYGHPTAKLLGILGRTGTMALRTDQEGMILISRAPGSAMRVWTQKQPAAAVTGRPASG